jgi:secreted trypsin-like serine protease
MDAHQTQSRIARPVASACLAAATAVSLASVPAHAAQPAVVGGGPASIADTPWLVAVITDETRLCSGSLLTPTVVLTAAHCVDGYEAGAVEVFAGISDLSQRGPQDSRAVAGMVVHPGYRPEPAYANDLALLTLAAPVPGTTGARTIALPVSQDPAQWPAAGTPAGIVGWGSTDRNSQQASSQLQAARVQVLSGPGQPCGQYGDHFDASTVICGGLPDGSIDTCQGDSGGPFAVDVAGRPVLAGTVVAGSACASADFPGLYARLTAYVPWIASQGVDVAAAAAAAGQPLASPTAPTTTQRPTVKVGTRITAATAARWAGLPTKGATVTAKRTKVCRQAGAAVKTTARGTCTVVVTQGARKATVRVTVTR